MGKLFFLMPMCAVFLDFIKVCSFQIKALIPQCDTQERMKEMSSIPAGGEECPRTHGTAEKEGEAAAITGEGGWEEAEEAKRIAVWPWPQVDELSTQPWRRKETEADEETPL